MGILEEAKKLQGEIQNYRRYLHAHAETGFALKETAAFVLNILKDFGCKAERYGKSGILAEIGQGRGEVILLRADMDGLPIREKTGLPFACKNGNMHACGHDMHAACLLGAARLLKAREKELSGKVFLLFQPAEELLLGAKEAVETGVIKKTGATAAVTMHVLTNTELPTGRVLVSSSGLGAPSADFFTVRVSGKSCHGSSPWLGRDALTVAARILLGLEELAARELSFSDPAVLTMGSFQGGKVGNAIAGEAMLKGTLRAYEEDTRVRVKRRLEEISKGIAKAFCARVKISYEGGCPTLVSDKKVSDFLLKEAKGLWGKDKAYSTAELGADVKKGESGSEDFAYIAKEVPSATFALACGEKKDGYVYPLHHEKTAFDESALYIGSATFARCALAWGNKKE